jgi:hypothetical protein
MTRSAKRSIGWLAAVILLWLLFAQAVRGAVISSLASDEGPHLAVGYSTLRTGDLRLQPIHIHPPLINVLAGAPLLLDPSLPDPRAIPGWEIASLSAVTDTVIWKHTPPDGIALAGRLPIILLAVLLGAFVYRWAVDLAGWRAGLLALFLYALDPNIVAHAQVITTDMGVTVLGFITLYCCYKSANQQIGKSSFKWTVGTGVALGAALAAKVSAALLAPLLAVIVLVAGRDGIVQRVRRVLMIALIAFGVVWAVYGFEVGYIPGVSVPVPMATHVKVYQSLQQHYDEGHPAFLIGMNSTRGWWYYFPGGVPRQDAAADAGAAGGIGGVGCKRQDAGRQVGLGVVPHCSFCDCAVQLGGHWLPTLAPHLAVLVCLYCCSNLKSQIS